MAYDANTNTWRNSEKVVYTYNTNGDITRLESFSWNTERNEWISYYYRETTYDAKGRDKLEISYLGNIETTEWIGDQGTAYWYDADGSRYDISFDWNSEKGQWDLSSSDVLANTEYDAANNKTLELYKAYDANTATWVDSRKIEFAYNDDKTIATTYKWDVTATDWVASSKTETTFDANLQNNTVIAEYDWSAEGDTWIGSSKTEYVYAGNKPFEFNYNWNYEENKFEYTAEGLPIQRTNSVWNSETNQWVNANKLVLSDDPDFVFIGKPLYPVYYTWNAESNDWEQSTNFVFYNYINYKNKMVETITYCNNYLLLSFQDENMLINDYWANYNKNQNQWLESNKDEYLKDENGRTIIESYQGRWDNSTNDWFRPNLGIHSYDTNDYRVLSVYKTQTREWRTNNETHRREYYWSDPVKRASVLYYDSKGNTAGSTKIDMSVNDSAEYVRLDSNLFKIVVRSFDDGQNEWVTTAEHFYTILVMPEKETNQDENYILVYETNGDEATVTGIEFLKENVSSVIIPSTVTIEDVEYTVTAIGDEAFSGCSNLTSVTLPNSLTSIGDWAFYDCQNITSLDIPNSVTSIGDYAFSHCENMESITLPNTLTRISEEMFHSCYKLASITIPETVTSIGFDAFVACRSLTELKIPNAVTQIGAYAFYLCNNLTYNIYDSALYLGNDDNPYLCLIDAESQEVTSCEIHPDCRFINHRAFFFHENITTVSIPESVTRVGAWAFTGCGKLVFNEYDNALYLGNSENPYLCLVREKSSDITSCEVNSNCKIICTKAFGSNNLGTVTIPNSVTTIEDGDGCAFDIHQGTLYCQADSIPAGWQKWWKNDGVLAKWSCKVLNIGVNDAEYGATVVAGDVVELSDGSFWSPSGAEVTLTATPNEGYHFVKWSDNNNTASRTLNVTSDSTIAAIFEAHTAVTDTAVAATCTETGKTEGKHCSVCNAVLVAQEVIPANKHTNGDAVFENVIAATCTAAGSRDSVVYCTVCQAELSRTKQEIAKMAHTEAIDEAVAATCTESGLTEGKHCSVCNTVLVKQVTIPASGHTEVVDTTVVATCTEYGLTEGKHCSVCNAVLVKQDTIAALGHTEIVDAAVAATCTESGLTEGKHCSVCNEVLVAQTKIPALGHNFVNYVYNNDATTEADGTETATCEHGCGKTDTRIAEGTKLPKDNTAVSESAASAVNIYAHGKIIVVENATEEISVYNAMGKLICRDVACRIRAEINVNDAGVYIVKTGNVVKRVMVN